jgi:hypothetical protein
MVVSGCGRPFFSESFARAADVEALPASTGRGTPPPPPSLSSIIPWQRGRTEPRAHRAKRWECARRSRGCPPSGPAGWPRSFHDPRPALPLPLAGLNRCVVAVESVPPQDEHARAVEGGGEVGSSPCAGVAVGVGPGAGPCAGCVGMSHSDVLSLVLR